MLQYQVINDANETVVYIKVRISYWIANRVKFFFVKYQYVKNHYTAVVIDEH